MKLSEKLPKSISPCPIREVVAEVRFESAVPAEAVFGIVYGSLKDRKPKIETLPIAAFPSQIRDADQGLIFQPHYRMYFDTTMVMVGPRVITVGTEKEYPGWESLSVRMNELLQQVYATGVVKNPSRMGLRYISFFPFDIFPKLQLQVDLAGEPIEGEETQFKTILDRPGCRCLLLIGKDLKLIADPRETGSIIDIDSFILNPEGDFPQTVSRFLDAGHAAEKELFFSLLKRDFLATLNPVYV